MCEFDDLKPRLRTEVSATAETLEEGKTVGTHPDVVAKFPVRANLLESGTGIETLVEAESYDIRRVVAGPQERHGSRCREGDAFVLAVEGDVEFAVGGQRHTLKAWDLLWIPAGATREFVAGVRGVVFLAVHLPSGGSGSACPGQADQEVVDRVTAHHAHMAGRLERLSGAVGEAADATALHSSLSLLTTYWRTEILPHASAEETTFYAAARGSAGPLVEALLLEHSDLGDRARALAALDREAAQLARVGAVSGHEGLFELRSRAMVQAAAASALFGVHARKENEVVLPLLIAAGHPLLPILERMEAAFAEARKAAL